MAIKLKRTVVTLVIILGAGVLAASQLMTHAKDATLRDWYQGAAGYAQAKAEQQQNGKALAVYFYTDWCASCKTLREQVLSTPEVKEYMANLIPVKINPEAGPGEQALGIRFGVMGYPAFYILPEAGGKPVNILRSVEINPLQFIDACNQAV